MRQISPFQQLKLRFNNFSFAAKSAYSKARHQANNILPTIGKIRNAISAGNRMIQASSDYSPKVKETAHKVHNVLGDIAHKYSGAVNQWDALHNVAVSGFV